FAAAPAQAAAPAHSAPPATLYTPPANPDANQQIRDVVRHRQFKDAAGVLAMTLTRQAVWYGDGTPDEVRASVHNTVADAAQLKLGTNVTALAIVLVAGEALTQGRSETWARRHHDPRTGSPHRAGRRGTMSRAARGPPVAGPRRARGPAERLMTRAGSSW
ncbi:hypothetical protein ABT317_38090, partial [Streptomyces carpinensis]